MLFWDLNFLAFSLFAVLFLSSRDMKGQFAEHLYEMNFLSSKDPKAEDANINANNVSLVKAIICAGLYPNVAIVRWVVVQIYTMDVCFNSGVFFLKTELFLI